MRHRTACVLVLLGLAAAAGCDTMEQIASGPKDVTIQVNAPLHVKVKEEFVVEVRVQNTSAQSQRLDSIDVGDRYLQGVAIQRTEPAFKQSMHVPIVNMQSYEFGQPIAAGGEVVVKFHAVAVQAGDYSATVDVCINSASSCSSHPIRAVIE
ncbi:MAG TPA: hypothetical protein VGA39_02680 [Candidatus Acidoferrales bacterium]